MFGYLDCGVDSGGVIYRTGDEIGVAGGGE